VQNKRHHDSTAFTCIVLLRQTRLFDTFVTVHTAL